MQAVTQDRYGDAAEVLRTDDIERPVVGDDEVLIEVEAAGVDRGTSHLVAGLPYLVRLAGYGVRAPKSAVPGLDVAGRVDSVGKNVSEFAPGDQVFGIANGSFAEFATALATKISRAPAGITAVQAAAVPVSGLTAIQAVRDQAAVSNGQRVLVVGASGGVGSFAVQIAKAFGAEVTGVASTSKVDMVRRLGAEHVIDYTAQELDANGSDYDAILDIGGNRSVSELRRLLTPNGTLVIIGGEEGGRLIGGNHRQLGAMILSPFVGQKLGTFISSENAEDLAALRELIESGAVVPEIDRTFPLAEGSEAVQYVDGGRASGKVVVTVSPSTA
jgi:NADPH:quinone reductase-like Zn-dependent oxidoreductase